MNIKRWLLSGIVVGVILWLLESAASFLYLGKMQTALRIHDIVIEPTVWLSILSVVITLLLGLTLMFFYVAARPRFGAGPKTATLVAFMLWLGGYVPSLIGYEMIGIYPRTLLYQWGLVGLAEMIIGCVVGASIYREPAAATQ